MNSLQPGVSSFGMGLHDIYANPANGRRAPVPRHSEIKNSLCRLIRRQLGLEEKATR